MINRKQENCNTKTVIDMRKKIQWTYLRFEHLKGCLSPWVVDVGPLEILLELLCLDQTCVVDYATFLRESIPWLVLLHQQRHTRNIYSYTNHWKFYFFSVTTTIPPEEGWVVSHFIMTFELCKGMFQVKRNFLFVFE